MSSIQDYERILRGLYANFFDSKEMFVLFATTTVRDTMKNILGYETSVANLEACEKAVFGVRFEKSFIKVGGYPRKVQKKRKGTDDLFLDTVIDGLPLDIKTTLGGKTWMIPHECVGHWCLLVKVDWKVERFSIGILRADSGMLTTGTNQDLKHSVSKEGRENIWWIEEGVSYA